MSVIDIQNLMNEEIKKLFDETEASCLEKLIMFIPEDPDEPRDVFWGVMPCQVSFSASAVEVVTINKRDQLGLFTKTKILHALQDLKAAIQDNIEKLETC